MRYKEIVIAFLFTLIGFLISPWFYWYNQSVYDTINEWHESEYILDIATLGIVKGGESFLVERQELGDEILPLSLEENSSTLMYLIIGKRFQNTFWKGSPHIKMSLIFSKYLDTGNASRRWNFYIRNSGKKPLSLKIIGKLSSGSILGGTSTCGYPYLPDDHKEFEHFILRTDPNDECIISIIVEGSSVPTLNIESREDPKVRIIESGALTIVYPENVDRGKIEQLSTFTLDFSGGSILKKF